MNNIFKLKLMILFFFLLASMGYSEEVNVSSGIVNTLFNAVNDASAGDIFLLEDGGIYPNSEVIPVTVPLTVKTVEGYATKAKIVLSANSTGDYPWAMFNATAGFTLENVVCNGLQGDQSAFSSRFITRGDITGTLHVDGVEVSRFTAVSMGGDCDTLICENSFFNGCLSAAGGWGGTWDFQSDAINYVRIQNNTFMFCTFGPYLGTGWSSYVTNTIPIVIIDHNTIYNITGAHGPTFNCSNVEDIIFTNNLYVNGTFRPNEYFSNKFFDFPHNIDELVQNGLISVLGPKGMWLMSISMVQDAGTVIDMRNNNIYWTQDVLDKWDDSGLDKPWIYNNEFKAAIVDTNVAYFEEELNFVDAPETPLFAINAIADSCALGNADPIGWEGKSPYGGWEWWDDDLNATFDFRDKAEMDLSYHTNAISYTAGDNTYPLGDLNWWGQEVVNAHANDEPNPLTSITATSIHLDHYQLSQNYPNPFNSTTLIQYQLDEPSHVKLTVYNFLGQKVTSLVDVKQLPGSFKIVWQGVNDNGNQVCSGIYVCQLETDNSIQINKMILLR